MARRRGGPAEVAVPWRTHRSSCRGRGGDATARELRIDADHTFLLRFEGDLLVEVWEVLDSATLLRQLETASDFVDITQMPADATFTVKTDERVGAGTYLLTKILVRDVFKNASLLDVLHLGGGGKRVLRRHAVAAVLDAAHPDGEYDLTEAQVVDMFSTTSS